jgi:membrane-anchored glycerophosphoryl diester phosphodiesterase (GDPDase)
VSVGGPAPAAGQPLLRLRPLGLGEILDDVFRIYRRHFGLFCGIALALSLPRFVVELLNGSPAQYGFLATILGSITNPAALAGQRPPAPPSLGLLGLTYLVIVVTIPFTLGAVTWAAIALVLGNPVTVRSALLGVARRYWTLMGMAVVVLPLVLCPPVLIWLGVRWVVAVPAALAEAVGPIRALTRSWDLTRRSWWRLAGILLVTYVLVAVAQSALGIFALPLAIVVPFVPEFVRGVIFLVVTTAAQVVTLPLLDLCVVLVYFDLRVRRDAFDLDQLAVQAGASIG